MVRLTDPSGFRVEVVAGANSAYEKPRLNTVKRVARGPSHVKRPGRCVLNAKDFRESEAWYKSRFGLPTSDEISLDSKGRGCVLALRPRPAPERPSHPVPDWVRAAEVQPCRLRSCGLRRPDVRKRLAARKGAPSRVGYRASRSGQPDFRLLARSTGAHDRALDRRRPARCRVGFTGRHG